jgi:hypothetical protein
MNAGIETEKRDLSQVILPSVQKANIAHARVPQSILPSKKFKGLDNNLRERL